MKRNSREAANETMAIRAARLPAARIKGPSDDSLYWCDV
jgi:hypothetical protein